MLQRLFNSHAENIGQQLNNVYRFHQVIARSKLVLQRMKNIGAVKLVFTAWVKKPSKRTKMSMETQTEGFIIKSAPRSNRWWKCNKRGGGGGSVRVNEWQGPITTGCYASPLLKKSMTPDCEDTNTEYITANVSDALIYLLWECSVPIVTVIIITVYKLSVPQISSPICKLVKWNDNNNWGRTTFVSSLPILSFPSWFICMFHALHPHFLFRE